MPGTIKQQQNTFVCTLFAELCSQGNIDSFQYPPKIPTQIQLPKKIHAKFSYPKISWNRKFNSNPKKSFDHPRHLKFRVPALGLPSTCRYAFIRLGGERHHKSKMCICLGTQKNDSWFKRSYSIDAFRLF